MVTKRDEWPGGTVHDAGHTCDEDRVAGRAPAARTGSAPALLPWAVTSPLRSQATNPDTFCVNWS